MTLEKLTGLSNHDYHNSPEYKKYVSSSGLKDILVSPEYFQYQQSIVSVPTKQMALGSGVHTMILEPWNAQTHVLKEPDINKRTNAGQAVYKLLLDGLHKDAVVLDEKQYETAALIKDRFDSQPELTELFSDGEPEVSFMLDDSWCNSKIRVDYLKSDLIIDLKTTSSPLSEFGKSCANFMYDLSAAFYCHVSGIPNYKFVVVETNPPYNFVIFQPDAEFMAEGKRKMYKALDILKECQEYDVWPGVELEQTLTLPRWYVGE